MELLYVIAADEARAAPRAPNEIKDERFGVMLFGGTQAVPAASPAVTSDAASAAAASAAPAAASCSTDGLSATASNSAASTIANHVSAAIDFVAAASAAAASAAAVSYRVEAANVACQIRTTFGQTVDPKGENAIHALLLMRDNPSLRQKDAQEQCGTSKGSIQKYRKLLAQLQSHAEAPVVRMPVVRMPVGLLSPDWLLEHTCIVGWRVVATESLADGTSMRTFCAMLTVSAGHIERDIQVMFDPAPSAVQSNWKREAAAARQLADAWLELKSEPASSLTDSSHAGRYSVNIVRRSDPRIDHRRGDWVWIPSDPTASFMLPVASVSAAPALAKVNHCFANGALEVVMFNMESLTFNDTAPTCLLPPCTTRFQMMQQAMPLGDHRPRHIGEIIRLCHKPRYHNVFYKDEFDEWVTDVWHTPDGVAKEVRRSATDAWSATDASDTLRVLPVLSGMLHLEGLPIRRISSMTQQEPWSSTLGELARLLVCTHMGQMHHSCLLPISLRLYQSILIERSKMDMARGMGTTAMVV